MNYNVGLNQQHILQTGHICDLIDDTSYEKIVDTYEKIVKTMKKLSKPMKKSSKIFEKIVRNL